jgi:hypothetical protein
VALRADVEALRRQRIAAGERPVRELSVSEAREAERAELGQRGEPEPVAEVVEGSLPGPVGFQFASIGRNPGSRFQRSSTSSAAGG